MGWIEQRRTQRCGVSYCYPDVEAGLSELKRDGWFGVFGIPKQQDAGFKRDRRGLNQLFPVGTSPWRCSISPLYCQYVLHYFYIFCCIYICSSIYLSIHPSMYELRNSLLSELRWHYLQRISLTNHIYSNLQSLCDYAHALTGATVCSADHWISFIIWS